MSSLSRSRQLNSAQPGIRCSNQVHSLAIYASSTQSRTMGGGGERGPGQFVPFARRPTTWLTLQTDISAAHGETWVRLCLATRGGLADCIQARRSRRASPRTPCRRIGSDRSPARCRPPSSTPGGGRRARSSTSCPPSSGCTWCFRGRMPGRCFESATWLAAD